MKLRTIRSVLPLLLVAACAETPDGAAPQYDEIEGAASNLPDLTCAIAGPTTMPAGGSATFQVTTSNIGLAKAYSPRIDVIVPAGYTPSAPTGGCTWYVSTRTMRCTFTNMNGGNTRTGAYTLTAPTVAGTLTQQANAYLNGTDANPTNNRATLVTTVTGADLAVTISGPGALAGGTSGSYVATVRNNGTLSSTSVWLTLGVPNGAWPTLLPSCVIAGFPTRVRCNLGTIAPGAILSRTVTYGFPYTPGAYSISAAAVGAVAESAAMNANNAAAAAVAVSAVTPVAVTMSLPAPQQMMLTNCFGDPGDFGSFAACSPAWLQSGVLTFLDGGTIDTGDSSVNGSWSQPSGPESLEFEFTDALTGEVLMAMDVFGVSSTCFEGLNWWPTESENRGAFSLCTL